MAKLLPEVRIEEIENKPERDVAKALIDTLSDDFLVFHSYPWIKKNGKRIFKGETDFLLFDQKSGGILVLEVKGGDIRYDSDSARWYRDCYSKKQIKNPFEQANDGLFQLANKVSEAVFGEKKQKPYPHGYAVVFPDCDFAGNMPPGADREIIFGHKDLPRLGDKLGELLEKWSGQNVVMKAGIIEKMRLALLPEFNLIQLLSKRFEQEEEALVRLTESQSAILGMLSEWPQALIEGVAGSGKTLLALTQSIRFAEMGHRVLFTCYNKRLAGWLQKNIPDALKEQVKVRHFHGLAYDFCRDASIEFKVPENEEAAGKFWRDEVPDLMVNAASSLGKSYDAIVVDEGQDFFEEWWSALHCLNDGGENGKFYIFYDPAQNLYSGGGFKSPLALKPCKLQHNCRNTRKIAAYCGEIIDQQIAVQPFAPEGQPCEMFNVSTEEQAVKCLQTALDKLIHLGLKPSQIAILSPHKRSETALRGKQKLGKSLLTNDFDKWRNGEGVLFETIRSFKGLEADAIILYALPEPDGESHFTKADYYVASSRAKHLLQVIRLANI